jgi:hypothetical protein
MPLPFTPSFTTAMLLSIWKVLAEAGVPEEGWV